MTNRRIWELCALLALLPITLVAQANRISGEVDSSRLLSVPGNVNPRATAAADQGPVDPAMKLNYVRLMLKPSPAQQAQLDQLLREQQTPGSPNFHKWLTPEQFAAQFGVSQADIAKITTWMRSQGFDVITVGRGRKFIAFNATAQQIQSALKTEIHHYRVKGELHFANATEPSVPAAIQPLVLAFIGLDDFQPKPAIRTNKVLKPSYTAQNGNNALAPGDLAIIYNLLPVYNMNYTGSGESIAVIGRVDVQMTDINTFRSTFGLSYNPPQRILVPGSADPGMTSTDDEGESDLDLEWAGAIAPNATVLFVTSTSITTSVGYAIDQVLAPVITISYGLCELAASSADAGTYQSLAQQANAEGITWLNSSGDSGAASCDSEAAENGLSVQVEPAVPEITGVGGLMFNEGTGNYWNFQNYNNGSSATGYIPEKVWNESTLTQLSSGGGGLVHLYSTPLAGRSGRSGWSDARGAGRGSRGRGRPRSIHHRQRGELPTDRGDFRGHPVLCRDDSAAQSMVGNQQSRKYQSNAVRHGGKYTQCISRHRFRQQRRSVRKRLSGLREQRIYRIRRRAGLGSSQRTGLGERLQFVQQLGQRLGQQHYHSLG